MQKIRAMPQLQRKCMSVMFSKAFQAIFKLSFAIFAGDPPLGHAALEQSFIYPVLRDPPAVSGVAKDGDTRGGISWCHPS